MGGVQIFSKLDNWVFSGRVYHIFPVRRGFIVRKGYFLRGGGEKGGGGG